MEERLRILLCEDDFRQRDSMPTCFLTEKPVIRHSLRENTIYVSWM